MTACAPTHAVIDVLPAAGGLPKWNGSPKQALNVTRARMCAARILKHASRAHARSSVYSTRMYTPGGIPFHTTVSSVWTAVSSVCLAYRQIVVRLAKSTIFAAKTALYAMQAVITRTQVAARHTVIAHSARMTCLCCAATLPLAVVVPHIVARCGMPIATAEGAARLPRANVHLCPRLSRVNGERPIFLRPVVAARTTTQIVVAQPNQPPSCL